MPRRNPSQNENENVKENETGKPETNATAEPVTETSSSDNAIATGAPASDAVSAPAENAQEQNAGPEDDDNQAEETPFVKQGFARVQIKDFRGSYADAKFDDQGVCERISKETLEQLAKQFPGAEVLKAEEVE